MARKEIKSISIYLHNGELLAVYHEEDGAKIIMSEQTDHVIVEYEGERYEYNGFPFFVTTKLKLV